MAAQPRALDAAAVHPVAAQTDAAARIFQELCERFNVSLDNADMARLRNDLENYLSRGLLSSIE